jgi:hypothetical protein
MNANTASTVRTFAPPDGYVYRYLGVGRFERVDLDDSRNLALDPLPNLVEAYALTLISPSGRYDFDDLPALTKITGPLTVKDNPHISGCDIERFLARLEVRPSSVTVSGNALPNACP